MPVNSSSCWRNIRTYSSYGNIERKERLKEETEIQRTAVRLLTFTSGFDFFYEVSSQLFKLFVEVMVVKTTGDSRTFLARNYFSM